MTHLDIGHAAALIKMVYQSNPAGGGLHVQLDDKNLADRFFDDESRASCQTEIELKCFDYLKKMSITQRRKALHFYEKNS
jgi:hypothetical protein